MIMENYSYRSNSCREVEISSRSNHGVPTSMQELRSYSTTHANYYYSSEQPRREHQIEIKKVKKGNNFGKFSSSSRSWSLISDPELQRKKRVAGYKVYAVEGKMKGSLRKSFRWIKQTYNQVVYGWP